MREPRTFIDDVSTAGTWRAALFPDTSCRACGQLTCGHFDAVYAGIVPAAAPLNTVPHASGVADG